MNIKNFLTCLLFFSFLLSACASPAAPTASVVPISSPTEAVAGTEEVEFHPLSTRTGIADVDVVLAAVESGDPQQLRDLIRFTAVACTRADGLGGPPKCQEDEAEGTLVEVLPFLGPEGHFLRKADMSDFPGISVIGLYAIYGVSEAAYSEEAYPMGEYAVMFAGGENQPSTVVHVQDGIVRIDYIFPPTSLGEIIQRDASDLIVSPR